MYPETISYALYSDPYGENEVYSGSGDVQLSQPISMMSILVVYSDPFEPYVVTLYDYYSGVGTDSDELTEAPAPFCDPEDPACYLEFEEADSTNIYMGLSRIRTHANFDVAQMCGEMETRFTEILGYGWVYRGDPGLPDGAVEHDGAALQMPDGTWMVHIDGEQLDLAQSDSLNREIYQNIVATTALHEAAHTLGHTHSGLNAQGGYDEWPFNSINPNGGGTTPHGGPPAPCI